MGDTVPYSTATRESVGLPSISTLTPLLGSNNGFREQHSPRFPPSNHATPSHSSDSKPFSAQISFAPLGATSRQAPRREGAPLPATAIFHTESVPLIKKSPIKKPSPVSMTKGPPPKKIALPTPPKNGSSSMGGGCSGGMSALEAALRSPSDSLTPLGHPRASLAPPPPPPATHASAASRNLEFVLDDGLSPFNPTEQCALMTGPHSNGTEYGYEPSPSNGHRSFFAESSRESPLTLAPLEPLTTTFPTHSPVTNNGSGSYYSDWANPSLGSPMQLPPLTSIFSGHAPNDQSHSSAPFSASPMSAYSDPSPSASLLSVSVQQQQHLQLQQQASAGSSAAAAAAARPASRSAPNGEYGHLPTSSAHHYANDSLATTRKRVASGARRAR
ncbi:hypothetical protein PFISCL1PPCAC_11326, partial [Pristionchus fissidentatus]